MRTLKGFKVELDRRLNNISQVFIVPHMGVDFDAIASCIGMSLIVKKLGISCYIIIDDLPLKIDSGVKLIMEEIDKKVNIINMDKYRQLFGDNDLLILMDVNKSNLICCGNYLNQFKDIIIIDHHNEDENTVNCDCKFIDKSISSISEIVTELMNFYSLKYDKRIADYLLAGIYLDTNKLTKNVSAKTMGLVSKLISKGGSLDRVNEFFEEDFVSDRKVQDLVGKANFLTYNIATCIADDSIVFTKEELAKAADYLLKYKVDAAFAAGFIDDDLISISARSKGKIDVGEVMSQLDGGGNLYSGATKIKNGDISGVGKRLEKIIKPSFCRG